MVPPGNYRESHMAIRKTVYLSDQALEIIGPDPESLAGRINSIIIRYGEVARRHCPSFSVGEWCAIFDTLNGTWLMAEHGNTDPARYLWAEVSDNEGIGDKWSINQTALVERLRGMSYAENIAIIEAVTRFWQDDSGTTAQETIAKLNLPVTQP